MKKEERILSPFYISDMPYIEGKQSKDVLFKASPVTLGSFVRYSMLKEHNIVSICSLNNDFVVATHGTADINGIKNRLIQLLNNTGVVVSKVETQTIVAYCPVCKKQFTENVETCDNPKHHGEMKPMKKIIQKQPIIIKIKDFHLV